MSTINVDLSQYDSITGVPNYVATPVNPNYLIEKEFVAVMNNNSVTYIPLCYTVTLRTSNATYDLAPLNAVSLPLNIYPNADNCTITGNRAFANMVTVNLLQYQQAVTNITVDGMTIRTDPTISDGKNLELVGNATQTVNLKNNNLTYQGAPTIYATPNLIVNSVVGNSINIKNFQDGIFFSNLTFPISISSNIALNLQPNSSEDNIFNFVPFLQPFTLNLLDNIVIYNTEFAVNCTINLNSYSLELRKCTLANGASPLATVNGTGNVYMTQNTLLNPQGSQLLSNTFWAGTGTLNAANSFTSTPCSFTINMASNNYADLNDLNAFWFNGLFRLVDSRNAFTVGQTSKKLQNVFRLLIDNVSSIINSNNFVVNLWCNASVTVKNTNANAVLGLNANALTASSGLKCLVDNSSTNKNVLLSGVITNSDTNLADMSLVLNVSSLTCYLVSTGLGQVDLSAENVALLNLLHLTGNNVFALKTSNGTAPTLILDNNILMAKCDFNNALSVVLNGDMSMSNSRVIGNMTCTGTNNLAITSSHINSVINKSSLGGNVSITGCVVELADTYVVSNIGAGAITFSNNTCNVAAFVDFTNVGYDNGYFSETNIFNFKEAISQLRNLRANRLIRIASNVNCTINVLGDSVNSNTKFIINGDKLAPSNALPTFVANAGSSSTITFSKMTFLNGTGEYINYIAANNVILSPVVAFDVNNIVTFNINNNCSTMNSVYNAVGTAVNYNVLIDGYGNFNLNNDPLVVVSKTVNLATGNANSNLRTLSFNNRLTMNVTGGSNSFVTVTANGLNINDTNATAHALYLLASVINIATGSSADNAVNVVTSAASGCTLVSFNNATITCGTNNSVFNVTNNAVNAAINVINSTNIFATALNQYVYINASTVPAVHQTRMFTIDASTLLPAAVPHTYFVINYDNMLLTLNAISANPSSKFEVLWPGLAAMAAQYASLPLVSPVQDVPIDYQGNYYTPLNGSAVKYGFAWDYKDAANTVQITNYCNATGNRGLVFPNNLATTPTTCPWLDTLYSQLHFICVYSPDAVQGVTQFTMNMIKDYTNSSTSHTGKITNNWNYFNDSETLPHSQLHGWLDFIIDFGYGTSTQVVMPPTNNGGLRFSNDADPATFTFPNNLYVISQSQTINGVTILQYINTNLNRNDVAYPNANQSFPLKGEYPRIADANFPNDTLTGATSKTISYNITPFAGNRFNFLNDVNVLLSNISSGLAINGNTPQNNQYNLLYPGIDTLGPNRTYEVILTITDNQQWQTKTYNTTPTVTLYTTTAASTLTTIITYGLDLLQLYIFNLNGLQTQSLQYLPSPQNPYYILNTTCNQVTDNGSYKFNLVESVSDPVTHQRQYLYRGYVGLTAFTNGGQPLTVSTDNLVVDNQNITIGNVTIKRWTQTAPFVWNALDDNTMTNSTTLYRFQIDVLINNIRDYNVQQALELDVNFFATNAPMTNTPLKSAPLSINYFQLPLYIDMHTSDNYDWNSSTYTKNIARNTPFTLYVKFSGKVSGVFTPDLIMNAAASGVVVNGQAIDMTAFKQYIQGGVVSIPIESVNELNITYNFNPDAKYIVGNFNINATMASFTLANNPISYIALNSSVLTYVENNIVHTLTMRTDRSLNANGDEQLNGNNALATSNIFNINDSDNSKLVPAGFNIIPSTPFNLVPFNKYTLFYFKASNNSNAITITNNAVDLTSQVVEKVTLSFQDENGNAANDVEVFVNGVLATAPYAMNLTTLTSDAFTFRRRIINLSNGPDATYKVLRVKYQFTNASNFANLDSSLRELAVVDYSNCALTAAAFSEIVVGNFRIYPLGDGSQLIYRRITDGSNPMFN